MSTRGNAGERVAVVSSQALFAELLCQALTLREDLASAGYAGTINEAAELCASAGPDVVVVDCALPDGDGLDAAERILAAAPLARIILLTAGPAQDILSRATEPGISAVLPMNASLESLMEAIRHALPGATTVHPSLLVPAVVPGAAAKAPALTRREMQVLVLLAEGSDVRTTARNLDITVNTCRGYVKSILSKLDSRTQLQAVASARKLQLLA